MKEKPLIISSQLNSSRKIENYSHSQLSLRLAPQKPAAEAQLFRQKPQISSIPGVSPRERHRYRVKIGNEILGDQLPLEQSLELAGGVR